MKHIGIDCKVILNGPKSNKRQFWDRIHLAQVREQRRAVVITIFQPWFPQMSEISNQPM
jgi:hypothetical protein